MRVRIVVADENEARFYDSESADARLELVASLTDPDARLHDRDLKSDRPGRVFDHAATGPGRRGAVSHHGTGGERRPRKHATGVFASRIATELEQARREHRFERMILVAGPPFLGTLRKALPESLRATVAAEVHKDLVHQADSVVQAHLPREAFGLGA